MNTDPLIYFYNQVGFDSSLIDIYEAGELYAVIQLKDGNMGVCGIHKKVTETIPMDADLDLNRFSHRVLYTCYLNALFNHKFSLLSQSSFVETIQPNQFKTIVMIGLFRPLLERLSKVNIYPVVFDFNKDEPGLTPMEEQNDWLLKADLVILSATTIPNQTFNGIVEHTNKNALIVLTGPTSIIHPDLFLFLKRGIVSGMIFEKNQNQLIESIQQGNGTRHFKQFGKKVDLYPESKIRF